MELLLHLPIETQLRGCILLQEENTLLPLVLIRSQMDLAVLLFMIFRMLKVEILEHTLIIVMLRVMELTQVGMPLTLKAVALLHMVNRHMLKVGVRSQMGSIAMLKDILLKL
jgi:hypothetical protein